MNESECSKPPGNPRFALCGHKKAHRTDNCHVAAKARNPRGGKRHDVLGKSFAFHGYSFYMIQRDVAYSDDGMDCCEITAYNIEKENWSCEIDGKTFRYYNSFNCPYCKSPYIDYKKHPENKVFGVCGCVHLGRKHYQSE